MPSLLPSTFARASSPTRLEQKRPASEITIALVTWLSNRPRDSSYCCDNIRTIRELASRGRDGTHPGPSAAHSSTRQQQPFLAKERVHRPPPFPPSFACPGFVRHTPAAHSDQDEKHVPKSSTRRRKRIQFLHCLHYTEASIYVVLRARVHWRQRKSFLHLPGVHIQAFENGGWPVS